MDARDQPSLLTSRMSEKHRELESSLSEPIDLNTFIESDPAVMRLSDVPELPTSSFRHDLFGAGIKSSQQLRVDWSRFENHTFFGSAQASVNVAFDRTINGFPFDGTRADTETFLDGLTGFEKWVYDSFPKNVGYLNFVNSYVSASDAAGSQLPTLSRRSDGASVLDPGTDKSLTVEMHLYWPPSSNGTQVLCQKLSGSSMGFTLFASASSSTLTGSICFAIASGSSFVSASAEIPKGRFVHLASVFDRREEPHRALIYVDAALAGTSSKNASIGRIAFASSPLLIGSGSSMTLGSFQAVPTQTLSGSIDELRIYHSVRTPTELRVEGKRGVYARDDLKLYYKFNEPTGTLGSSESSLVNRIVLDSSGNALHGGIEGTFVFSLRSTGSITGPMSNERRELSPVLFPSYQKIVSLNERLLASASAYDLKNPNIITRLVPPHLFEEGRVPQGLQDELGELVTPYTGSGAPGTGQLGSSAHFVKLLFSWAKFFDELKLSVDSFANIRWIDYDENDAVPDSLLGNALRDAGFPAHQPFSDATLAQFSDGDDIGEDPSVGRAALRDVYVRLMRRLLTNAGYITRSKGTLAGVRALIRSLGIDPDNSLKIREFGGRARRPLTIERDERTWISRELLLTASSALLVGPFLSASRLEVGTPDPTGPFVLQSLFPPHGISSSPDDGLLTSGSWTYEASYRFLLSNTLSSVTQSLVRLQTTGSLTSSTGVAALPGVLANLVAVTGSQSYLQLLLRPSASTEARVLSLTLSGANVFDGQRWSVAFGRRDRRIVRSPASASYFLYAARAIPGTQEFLFVTSSLFDEGRASIAFQKISSLTNTSGAYFAIGSQSLPSGLSSNDYRFLNSTDLPAAGRATSFSGRVSHVKFWTKELSVAEFTEHARDPASLGVENPSINFAFERVATGSFERLRVDLSLDQDITSSNTSGNIEIRDFSQSDLHASASGLVASIESIARSVSKSRRISHRFDEFTVTGKVRARGFSSDEFVSSSLYARLGTATAVDPSDEVNDDPRLSIDFSLIDALDREQFVMFSSLDRIEDELGDPTNQFSLNRPIFDRLTKLHAVRLSDPIELQRFFKLFRWFDSLLEPFLKRIISRRSRFFGMNFVIEPHTLERSSTEYRFSDSYVDEHERSLPASIVETNEGNAI